jgi:Zn-dependent M28 family amino/carboxypeptidase
MLKTTRTLAHGFTAFLILAGVLAQSVLAQRQQGYSNLFNEDYIKAHIKFLSDDLLEGRGTGARGGELAARYVASQFEALGLKGAAPGGSFMQPVSLVGVKADPSTKLKISGKQGSETLKFADDFVAFTGAQQSSVKVDADMLFVGYGINAPELKWNDYPGDPARYRGKVLVMLVNDPPATESEPMLFGGKALTYYGRWTYKYEEAARHGAAGVILIHTDASAGYPWSVVRTSNGSWRFDIARTSTDQTPYLDLRSWVTESSARRFLQLTGRSFEDLRGAAAKRGSQPIDLGLRCSINLKSEVKAVSAPNVVAVYEGADPKLKNEYVVYSAHWDHLGIGEPNKSGDTIYNGAVDNASGVAAVLGIARAYTLLPAAKRPRRSILFLIPTSEEQGLLGAEWYSKHPLRPLAATAADVNLDSMNILGLTRDFVPLGAERSSLQSTVQQIALERHLKVVTDPRPEQGSFYRSDHFPFARVGVPSISLKEGDDFVGRPEGWGKEQFTAYNTANYHQPSDQYSESWNFEGLLQETEIAFAIGKKVADGGPLPKFNSGDEFARVSR